MKWIKVSTSPRSASDDAAVLSRRKVLAGLGFAGLCAVAGSTLLAARPAEARVDTPVPEPQTAPADAAKAEVAECSTPESNLAKLDTADVTDVSAQWRRRRYYGYRRRYWRRRRRRYWRRARVVCRRRWVRGRIVRVCRRVWW